MTRSTLLAMLVLAPALLRAQDVGPKVGDLAPDFTLPAATMNGVSSMPVHLASLRGRIVVLAFFPRVRTSGCTIQMKAYRDQYATLFGGGKDVTLLAISTDSAGAQASWAVDEKFPFTFVSDAGKVAGPLYATLPEGRSAESRVAFVIGKDGKIARIFRPFREIDATAYTELGDAISAAKGSNNK